jgi:type IV pilus assembly protein PilF
MKNRVALMLALLGIALSGCVTETTGTGPKPADRDKQLQTLVELGIGYIRNGEYARAKENLNKALEMDPKSAIAHNTLALVFQLEREWDEAERHFKLALRYDPSFTRARNNYGAFLFARGRYSKAIEQLKMAAEDQFYTGRSTVFENLGVSYLRTGDVQSAEDAFQHSVALNPEQPRALLELADIRYDQNRFPESRDFYRRYQTVAQHNARSLWLCIRLARIFTEPDEEASCTLALKNIYPASEEYKKFQASARQ